jgi:hypothetical protein
MRLKARKSETGPRIAAILPIVETCCRLQIPIRDYLTAILPGLADLPVSRITELTPTPGPLDPNQLTASNQNVTAVNPLLHETITID